MTFLTFPLLDEDLLGREIGAWQGIHNELDHYFVAACGQLGQAWNGWDGDGRKRFHQWWRGVYGDHGAKVDFQKLLEMVHTVVTALKHFDAQAEKINGPLRSANEIIAGVAPNGWFHLQGYEYEVVAGTMYALDLPFAQAAKIHIEIGWRLGSTRPFPYTDHYFGAEDVPTPKWFQHANDYAIQAAGAFKKACQGCIDTLGHIQKLSKEVLWLEPYKRKDDYSLADDFVWGFLTGVKPGSGRTPVARPSVGADRYIKSGSWKTGTPKIQPGGDPFRRENVPSWYFPPQSSSFLTKVWDDVKDVFDGLEHFVEDHKWEVLEVLLVAVGEPELAGVTAALVDSSEFYDGLAEIQRDGASWQRIAGLSLDGLDLVVDADVGVKSVGEEIAQKLLGKRANEVSADVFDGVASAVEEWILGSGTKDAQGNIHIRKGSFTSATGTAQPGAESRGFDEAVDGWRLFRYQQGFSGAGLGVADR